jgi:hypothetical protein
MGLRGGAFANTLSKVGEDDTMTAIEELDRRVTALEAAQNDTTQTLRWVVAKLGRVSAVQDEHTLRFERIESNMGRMESDLRRVEADLKGLRADLPAIIIEAVREGIKAARS